MTGPELWAQGSSGVADVVSGLGPVVALAFGLALADRLVPLAIRIIRRAPGILRPGSVSTRTFSVSSRPSVAKVRSRTQQAGAEKPAAPEQAEGGK